LSGSRLDRIRRDYASLAEHYERRWQAFNQAVRRWVFAHWPDPLPHRPRVLDIGCGAGGLLAALAAEKPGLELIGLDVSRALLLQARQHAPSAALVETDAENPPFRPASFNVTCSLNVLHHLRNPAAHLAALARLTQPGGCVFLASFSGGRSFAMRAAGAWLVRRNPSWHRVLSRTELGALLSAEPQLVIEAQDEIRAGRFWYLQIYRLGC
jgi:SAM-dependent methyltransferase